MNTKRILITLVIGILVLFGIKQLQLDHRLLVDLAAKDMAKPIFKQVRQMGLSWDTDRQVPKLKGVSRRTTLQLLSGFQEAMAKPVESKAGSLKGKLISSHFRFKDTPREITLTSYHHWESESVTFTAAETPATLLKRFGLTARTPSMSLAFNGPPELRSEFTAAWLKIPIEDQKSDGPLGLSNPLNLRIDLTEKGTAHLQGIMPIAPNPTRLPGIEALIPPIIALLIAIGFRRILPALLIAVLSGAAVQQTGQPLIVIWHEISGIGSAILRMLQLDVSKPTGYIGPVLDDAFNLQILAFTFVLVGMIAVVNRMGGTSGLVQRLSKLVKGPRSAQAVTAMTGTALFFDDYANTVVVGTSGRSITDRFKISREKLAYIVDSTSAPVAGVALLSTWIGYEVGLFDDLLSHIPASAGLPTNGYGLFLEALPYRYYCFFALGLVFIIAFFGRDFGPMYTAEHRARTTGQLKSETETTEGIDTTLEKEGVPLRAMNALIPIAAVLGSIIVLVLMNAPHGIANPYSLEGLRLAFGNGDLDLAGILFESSVIGACVSMLLAIFQGLLSIKEIGSAFSKGVSELWAAACVLILAWAIKQVCDDLGTGSVILALMGDQLLPAYIPVVVFLLSGVIGFSTGTSWGTMALMLPIAAPLSVELSGDTVIVLASLAAVLDGAIWGDHCSPISDTTVLSSAASDCPHLDHVKTQAPYAILAMVAACLCGYIYVAHGGIQWVAYPIGFALLMIGVLTLGKKHDASTTKPAEE